MNKKVKVLWICFEDYTPWDIAVYASGIDPKTWNEKPQAYECDRYLKGGNCEYTDEPCDAQRYELHPSDREQ